MNANKKNLWDKILKVLIAVLSAIAGALGANASFEGQKKCQNSNGTQMTQTGRMTTDYNSLTGDYKSV